MMRDDDEVIIVDKKFTVLRGRWHRDRYWFSHVDAEINGMDDKVHDLTTKWYTKHTPTVEHFSKQNIIDVINYFKESKIELSLETEMWLVRESK